MLAEGKAGKCISRIPVYSTKNKLLLPAWWKGSNTPGNVAISGAQHWSLLLAGKALPSGGDNGSALEKTSPSVEPMCGLHASPCGLFVHGPTEQTLGALGKTLTDSIETSL